MQGMVRAEREITDSLKQTHQQIDDQLQELREALKVWAANRDRGQCCSGGGS